MDELKIIDATKKINEVFVEYVFGTLENKKKYIELFLNDGTTPKTKQEANEIIERTWDYEKSRGIIRNIFKDTDKYKRGMQSKNLLDKAKLSWTSKELGKIDWPFAAMAFDQFVQSVNISNLTEEEKDEKVSFNCVKFRRIKELNIYRNDYLEYLMFEHNHNIIPTLVHRRGVDFFINGKAYDQKVSRSVTRKFENDFGDNWKDVAINNPEKVAQYLYELQDEERFGSDPRLLVVYVDQDISSSQMEKIILSQPLKKPIGLNFTYNHKKSGPKNYSTDCFVLILHK